MLPLPAQQGSTPEALREKLSMLSARKEVLEASVAVPHARLTRALGDANDAVARLEVEQRISALCRSSSAKLTIHDASKIVNDLSGAHPSLTFIVWRLQRNCSDYPQVDLTAVSKKSIQTFCLSLDQARGKLECPPRWPDGRVGFLWRQSDGGRFSLLPTEPLKKAQDAAKEAIFQKWLLQERDEQDRQADYSKKQNEAKVSLQRFVSLHRGEIAEHRDILNNLRFTSGLIRFQEGETELAVDLPKGANRAGDNAWYQLRLKGDGVDGVIVRLEAITNDGGFEVSRVGALRKGDPIKLFRQRSKILANTLPREVKEALRHGAYYTEQFFPIPDVHIPAIDRLFKAVGDQLQIFPPDALRNYDNAPSSFHGKERRIPTLRPWSQKFLLGLGPEAVLSADLFFDKIGWKIFCFEDKIVVEANGDDYATYVGEKEALALFQSNSRDAIVGMLKSGALNPSLKIQRFIHTSDDEQGRELWKAQVVAYLLDEPT